MPGIVRRVRQRTFDGPHRRFPRAWHFPGKHASQLGQSVQEMARTKLTKPEYMTPPMFGYALAHLAWFQGEEKPAWAKHLHWNARPDFKQAVRFLFQTGESTFKP